MKNDTLIIGGHEFHSRFILGSGKYSLNIIEAAVRDAASKHQRREKRGRSGAHCPACA